MVATLIRVKYRMAWNGIRKETYKLVLTILAVIYFGFFYLMGLVGQILAAFEGEMAGTAPYSFAIAPLLSVFFLIAWCVSPIVGYGFDNSLDPQNFRTVTYPNKRLQKALIWATVAGVGAIITVAVLLQLLIAFFADRQFLGALGLIILTPTALYIYALWGRSLSTTLGNKLTATSKSKDRTALITTLLFIFIVAPLGLWMNLLARELTLDHLLVLASQSLWLPISAPFGILLAAYHGLWVQLGLQLFYTAALLVGGNWLWNKAFTPAMVGVANPLSPAAQQAIANGQAVVDPQRVQAVKAQAGSLGKELTGISFFSSLRLPNPAAALAARTLQMWLKDPRISASVISLMVFPLMGIIMPRLSEGTDGPDFHFFGFFIYFVPFLLAFTIASLVSYDSTAFAWHILTPTSGFSDRLGRLLGSLPPALTLLVLEAALIAFLNPSQIFIWILADLLIVFLLSYGATVVACTFWLPGVQPPGVSPMATKGIGNVIVSLLMMFVGPAVIAILYLPFYLVWWQLAIPAALVYGGGLFYALFVGVVGFSISARLFVRRRPHMLAEIRSWAGH